MTYIQVGLAFLGKYKWGFLYGALIFLIGFIMYECREYYIEYNRMKVDLEKYKESNIKLNYQIRNLNNKMENYMKELDSFHKNKATISNSVKEIKAKVKKDENNILDTAKSISDKLYKNPNN